MTGGKIKRFVTKPGQKSEDLTQPPPSKVTAPVLSALQAEPTPAPAAVARAQEARLSDGGALKRMQASGDRQRISHRAALDFLNILKSLAPVFKAATIYPGHNAAPEQIALAVRTLSDASVSLAEHIATTGDQLEIDSAWARRTLHEFTAELVSTYWISAVISKGDNAEMPDVSAEFFKPAIRAVMELPCELLKDKHKFDLTLSGAVQLSLLKGLTPIAIEVEKYVNFIALHVPGCKMSAEDLIGEIGQFLMEQALMHHERFLMDNSEASDDDRRAMLQALLGHSSSVILSTWELCKGEVYSGISDSTSVQSALDYMSQPQFTKGFPLEALKNRAGESIRRLVGTATYALSMMQRQSAEPKV